MRKNLSNEVYEWLFVVGVAVVITIALSLTLGRVNVWQQTPSTSDVEAPQQVLILETGVISPGLERVQ
jgi:hypothetical protein